MMQSGHGEDGAPAPFAPIWAMGLMTGTALDGFVDVALIRTDGARIDKFGPFALVAYEEAERETLRLAIERARAWDFEGPEPQALAEAEALVTRIYARSILRFLADHGLAAADVGVVGGHGLTVLHRPDRAGGGRTRQLLDGDALSKAIGIPTVWDFRADDVAAGGQGAPLAPIYHAAVLAKAGVAAPAAVLNLGGVANLTVWNGGEDLVAFDTGPANGPVNEWVEAHGRGAFDRDGALAAAGRAHEGRILETLDRPWFDEPPPKSLDRFDFDAGVARGLSLEDGAATLTALSAACLDLSLRLLPARPETLVVAGGGRKNPTLMAEIARRCGVRVVDADAIGLRGDAVEAECFAHLAVRRLRGLPISFPATTGAPAPATGGRVSAPA
jgi:anhydro-N-acetylmuramic acid kinase